MARHLSEMLLIVRAQNQASGALRRVGRDLSLLGRHRDLQIRQQKVLLQQQNLMRQRQRAMRELQSITSGSRALTLQRAVAGIESKRNVIQQRRNQLLQNQVGISRAIATAQTRLQKIDNDQYRRETQQLRLLAREKKAQAAADARLRERRAMLRSRGGVANVPEGMNAASLRSIENARTKLNLLQRMLQSNADRQRELAANSRLVNRAINEQIGRSAILGQKYQRTARDAEQLALQTQHVAARQRELALRANEVRAQLGTIAQRYAIVTKEQNNLNNAIRAAKWDRIGLAGRTMQHFGRVASYAALVVGAGLGVAANNAAQFEKQVTLVATQTGRVDANFARTTQTIVNNSKMLQKAFLDIGMDSTSSLEEINDAAYNLFSTIDQLGDSTAGLKQGAQIMKLFSDAAVAGGASIGEVAEGVIGTLSAFDDIEPTAKNITRILDQMFAAVRFGRVSFGEFADSLTTLTPAAKSAGQTLQTTLASFAFLTKPLGVAKARVGLPRLMEVLTRPKMVQGLKELGIEVADSTGKMFQLDRIIGNIVRKRPDILKNDLALMQFFKTVGNAEGTIQARRAFVFLARNIDSYRRILNKVGTDQNEFRRSLKAMSETPGVRWEKFMNQLRTLGVIIGQVVVPELVKVGPYITRVTDYIKDMDAELRGDIVRWTLWGVGIAGAVAVLSVILGPLIRLAAVLGRHRILWVGVIGGFVAASAAIGALTGDWDGLSTVVSNFFSLTDQGTWGWIAMFAVATAGAVKLTRAINGVKNAWIASTAVTTAGTAAGSLGGLAGMFGRGRRAVSDVKGASAIVRETSQSAGRLRALLTGAGLAAMAIPGPLWVAGAAIAAAAGGALLWQRHMDGVRERSERLREAQQRYLAVVSRPQTQAADFGRTGERIIDAKKLGIELQRQKLILQDLRTQYASASGAQKRMLGLDIQDSLIRIGEYTRMFADAQARASASSRQMANAIVSTAVNLDRYRSTQEKIRQTEQQLRTLRAQGAQRGTDVTGRLEAIRDLENKLRGLRGALVDIEKRSQKTGQILNTSFRRIVKDLQSASILPQKISPQAMQAALRLAMERGRMLTPAEFRAVIKATVDKNALANAKADIQKAVKLVRVDIQINRLQAKKTDLRRQLTAAIHAGESGEAAEIRTKLSGANEAIRKAQQTREEVERTFGKTIVQNVKVKVNPANTFPLGQAISQGIASGILSGIPSVNAAADALIGAANRAARAKAEVGSPSKLFERTVGIPIVRGIIKGMLQKEEIQKTAALVIDLFNGAFLQAKQQKIDAIGDRGEFDPLKLKKYEQQAKDALARYQKTHKAIDKIRAAEYKKKAQQMRGRQTLGIGDLIKDMQGQVRAMVEFNNALNRIKSRGAPVGLLNDLRALGVDGLKYIKLLSTATPKEFKKIVQAWNRMQGQIRKSQYQTLEDIKNWKSATRQQLEEFKDTASQKLLETYNELREVVKTNFGDLFAGLEDRTGQGFLDAYQAWNDQVADYQREIGDLWLEIDDINEEAAQRLRDAVLQRTQELQDAMGPLFSGEWMQGAAMANKQEWGVAATFDDLFADLQGQVNRFNEWRHVLTSLAGKVPAELAKQFESLGPEALDELKMLNGATDAQLAQYISVWQQGQNAIANIANQTTVDTSDLIARTSELMGKIGELTNAITKLTEPKPLSPDEVLNSLNEQITAFDGFEGVLQELRDKGLPQDIVMQLARMGPQALPYLNALNNMTTEQLNKFTGLWQTSQEKINTATARLMNDQLDLWYNHGSNIASALIAGVASEQQQLLDFFRKMFVNILKGETPNMPTAPVTLPPATSGGGKIGTPIGTGGGGGGGGKGIFLPMAEGGILTKPTLMVGGEKGPEAVIPLKKLNSLMKPTKQVNMTIHAHNDESLMSTLERASFRLRHDYD